MLPPGPHNMPYNMPYNVPYNVPYNRRRCGERGGERRGRHNVTFKADTRDCDRGDRSCEATANAEWGVDFGTNPIPGLPPPPGPAESQFRFSRPATAVPPAHRRFGGPRAGGPFHVSAGGRTSSYDRRAAKQSRKLRARLSTVRNTFRNGSDSSPIPITVRAGPDDYGLTLCAAGLGASTVVPFPTTVEG